MTLLPQSFAFAITLAGLLLLSRWITQQVLWLGHRLTNDENSALIGYYLLLFPGILLHELSHVAMAKLVGLKVGKFSLGPKPRRNTVELGSVMVSRGDALRESLVGLAPFIGGTIALLAIGYGVFDVEALGQAWRTGGWLAALHASDGIWRVPDFWLWAYLIFAISNAMTPSPADRQPWLLASIYVGAALVVAYFLGALAWLPVGLGEQVTVALQVLTLAFAFTLIFDVLAAVALFVAEIVIVQVQARRG
jgi:hypothetical protein